MNTHRDQVTRSRDFRKSLKEEAKNDRSIQLVVFDMQKTMLCPHGEASSFYYSPRLKIWNLTCTSLINLDSTCFVWSEADAKKGSREVATCVYNYLEELNNIGGIKTIYLFCDRCIGQNNNHTVLVMLSIAINKFDFDKIVLCYLVTGHSQTEADSTHSTIETFIKPRIISDMAEMVTCIRKGLR